MSNLTSNNDKKPRNSQVETSAMLRQSTSGLFSAASRVPSVTAAAADQDLYDLTLL